MPRFAVVFELFRQMSWLGTSSPQDEFRRSEELWLQATPMERGLAIMFRVLVFAAVGAAILAAILVYGYLIIRRFVH